APRRHRKLMASLVRAVSGMKPTSGIALRWEWRSFGQHFGGAEERIAKFAPSEPKETDEIYFLSGGGENVKVRDDLMDVKVLRKVNEDGLEQWAPVMKAQFPLSASNVATVLDAMSVPNPGSFREGCTLETILQAFGRPDSGV